MNIERIQKEADAFFEWPTSDKAHVTTTSTLLFARVIAEMAKAEEREACAKLCEEYGVPETIEGAHPDYLDGKRMAFSQAGAKIRSRK